MGIKKIVILQDVIFDETCFPGLSSANMPTPPPITAFEDLPEYEPYDSNKPIPIALTSVLHTKVDITFNNKPHPSVDSDNDSKSVGELPEEVGATPQSSGHHIKHTLPIPT